MKHAYHLDCKVSIHAPPNRKERQTVSVTMRRPSSFNPRPSQPEGATTASSGRGD